MKDITVGMYSWNVKDKKARWTKRKTPAYFFILIHIQVVSHQVAELQSAYILQQMKLGIFFFFLKLFLANEHFYPHGWW